MKNALFVLFALTLSYSAISQRAYFQQQANFNINVSLNDKENTLDAFESIEYINNSADTLRFIYFHLWPNAYKNDKTAFSEQLLANGSKDFYFSKAEDKGYINQLDFKVDNISASTEDYNGNIDVVKLFLPKPLPPSKRITITTPFHVKLPYNFSRGGHVGQDYQLTQWFPKPAVYDNKGWHPMPYTDQGEFYSEFGNFDVQVTLPGKYLVGASGVLQDEATLKEIKANGKHAIIDGNKTWHYKQNNIHDFAWFASKDFIAMHDTVVLASKKMVDVFSYFHAKDKDVWKEAVQYAKAGVRNYSTWLGDYPYTVASVVQGSKNDNSGGMEYPTITLITTEGDGHELDATIVHEVGHNWFYGALASNERDHPWMDEGMNTFYQKRYELNKYGTYSFLKEMPKLARKSPEDEEDLFLRMMMRIEKDQPIETPSLEFSEINYGVIAYVKASRWLGLLEQHLGQNLFDSCMREYYRSYKFKHPYPEDFKQVMEKSSGQSLEPFFELLNKTGPLKSPVEKRILKPSAFINLHNTEKYNYLNFSPAIGFNNYDKWMVGAMVHNYQLPLNSFQFLAGAAAAMKSKKVNPFARVSYTVYKKKFHFETAVSSIAYTQNRFTTETDEKLYLRIRRLVPSAKLTLFDKDPRKDRKLVVQWKSFLLKEEVLHFETDTSGADIVTKQVTHPNINRLALTYSDNRVLYPYSVNLTTDQGKDFLRTALTAKYFFNYSDNKTGLEARFFAGKFFYLNKNSLNRLSTDRYQLNTSGPDGREDYTYSDYFVGRSEFSGWMSQQIMERDGFFKIRTPMREVGQSDDWLMALNLVTDIPDKINPLTVLPIKIPFKVFVDVGTQAEAWKNNPATGKFIYDAGFQVSVFKSLINIYLPILYSRVYSDYLKTIVVEKKFQRSITFSINLQQFNLNKLLPGIPL